MWTWIEQFLAILYSASWTEPVFPIHLVPVLSQDPERRPSSPWIFRGTWSTECLRRSQRGDGQWTSSQSVAAAITCCWWRPGYGSVSSSAFLLVVLALGTHPGAASPGWLPSQHLGRAVPQQLPYIFSFILIFISCNWLSISLRDSCLLLPCQRWLFPQPWEMALGLSLPSQGREQLLFVVPEAWGEAAKLVQESLFLLTVFSSHWKFMPVSCNLWLMPNQLLFLNFWCNCYLWR